MCLLKMCYFIKPLFSVSLLISDPGPGNTVESISAHSAFSVGLTQCDEDPERGGGSRDRDYNTPMSRVRRGKEDFLVCEPSF